MLKSSQQVSEKQFLKLFISMMQFLSGDDEITKKVIDKAINLKVISKWGTGIDSIEHEYAKKRVLRFLILLEHLLMVLLLWLFQ